MTQRLARRAEDRFITTLLSLKVQRQGLPDVVIVMRFPVIGSRMVMGSALPFRHRSNAVPPAWIRFDCDRGYGIVTAP
jgi:hypothetical protein